MTVLEDGFRKEDLATRKVCDIKRFYSLVHKGNVKEKRKCLRCGIKFISQHKGNRTCSVCADYIDRQPARAQGIYVESDML